jgi:protein involved in polysaccharide export with SLBB domain
MDKGRQKEKERPDNGCAGPALPAPFPFFTPTAVILAVGLTCLLAGCAPFRAHVDQHLLDARGPTDLSAGVKENYVLGCPDVVQVTIAGPQELNLRAPVTADGCVDLGPLGKPHVEGRSVSATTGIVAELARVKPDNVNVRVLEYNSTEVYLFGQISSRRQAVPYQGQETVLDLLQRVGGIKPGAAPDDVFVVRPHIADGTRPEVFHVDLRAIVLKHDNSTNLRLQPFDQVHVGESRQSLVEQCVPLCLLPLFQAFCNTRPEAEAERPPRLNGPGRPTPQVEQLPPPRPNDQGQPPPRIEQLPPPREARTN